MKFPRQLLLLLGKNGACKPAAWLGIVIAAVAIGLSLRYGPRMAAILQATLAGRIFLLISSVFAAISLTELAWRAVLVLRYQPYQEVGDDLLPLCTVVVPAYNEGKQVFSTLESLAASNYPKNKLDLIAIDDGSVDDTWQWIRKAKEVLGGQLRITTIKQHRNKGKRFALYTGFRQSHGKILVTVDSDSTVSPDTLRNLVAPFIADPKIGAVAGNVRVLNQSGGIIPRMLDVAFVYSFDFIRASQSMVQTVMCTPGALSAYRRSTVMKILPEWLHQTFWRQPANIGEDRAMTNLILREGHHVVFQQNAVVYTEIPIKYNNLCKMYLRWARSDIRETIAMAGFIFKKFRHESRLGARINFISSLIAILKAPLFPMIIFGLAIWHPVLFGINTLIGLVVFSSLAVIIYAWKFSTLSSLWGFFYGLYFFLLLSWIKPYALLTPQNSGWLTRQLKPQPAPSYIPARAGAASPLTTETLLCS